MTTTSTIQQIVKRNSTVFDLGRPYQIGMPQSPNHPAYWQAMPRRHGDAVRPDGGSAANDVISMGTHVGTHIDAVSHVSHCGKLYGDLDAGEVQLGGKMKQHAVEDIVPIVCRGLLLDIPRVHGWERCPDAYEVTPSDLEAATEGLSGPPQPGDALIVRTGWGQLWDSGDPYIGKSSGVPGPGESGAEWIAAHRPRVTGADTIAFEHLPAGAGHAVLPAHRVLLVENAINIIEAMALEELAASGAREFVFVASPLCLTGATGSPVRPLAMVFDG